eukprot:SAG11_NODE_5567_length_1521_cov_2.116737_1_plen_274_part_10
MITPAIGWTAFPGCDAADAATAANLLVLADHRGIDSHGVARLHAYYTSALPRLASPHLASPHLAPPRLASPRLASPRHLHRNLCQRARRRTPAALRPPPTAHRGRGAAGWWAAGTWLALGPTMSPSPAPPTSRARPVSFGRRKPWANLTGVFEPRRRTAVTVDDTRRRGRARALADARTRVDDPLLDHCGGAASTLDRHADGAGRRTTDWSAEPRHVGASSWLALGYEARRDEARRGEARWDEARRGEARRGEARRGEARRGEARRGEARRGEA